VQIVSVVHLEPDLQHNTTKCRPILLDNVNMSTNYTNGCRISYIYNINVRISVDLNIRTSAMCR